jgi:DNA-binding CsgD family transcriptional regulator
MRSSPTEPSAAAPGDDGQQRDEHTEALASEIIRSLANLPVPMALLDIPDMRIRAANDALLVASGTSADALLGWSALEFSAPERRDGVRSDQCALADGCLEGFHAGRVFHLPDGRTVDASVWARRLEVDGRAWALAIVLPSDQAQTGAIGGFSGPASEVMMAVTDHLWAIEYASADASRVLGTASEDLVGTSLLALVHPGDQAGFSDAIASAVSSASTIVCATRMHGGPDEWQDVTCFISPLCDHSPPRLGLSVSRRVPTTMTSAPDAQARQHTLEQALWRIAREVRTAGLTVEEPFAITGGPPERAARLSGRQWEVVQRLAQGHDAATIAKAMYLRPSTVRNHLVAVYRKFGVHSQVQLLAMLRDDPGRLAALVDADLPSDRGAGARQPTVPAAWDGREA